MQLYKYKLVFVLCSSVAKEAILMFLMHHWFALKMADINLVPCSTFVENCIPHIGDTVR